MDYTDLCLKSNQYFEDMAETVKYASDYSPSVVYLNEIVGSKAFLKLASAGGKLPVSVGKDISGKPVVFDLVDEFGILISGATKQGKTVFMKTIVSSLMHGCAPSDLKIAIFNAMGEKEYAEFGPLVRPFDGVVPFLQKLRVGNPFPHVLVVIDMDLESLTDNGFADIVRELAECPDSRGVHIVLSTLRPSEIPRSLKKCFRRRMAFRMLSEDSICFLGKNGAAEWLKGNGDMLMKSGRSIRRVQCATISDGVSPCPYGDLTAYSAE